MDRSVDSIGSCSLDVDADSSDVSDTSSSLNFTTPLSAKDITREFTAKITERCQLSQNTTTYLDPFSGQIHTVITPTERTLSSPGKKPSYLNLACCVNGYSNLTTYDSKVRQDINKSREVSPIRPSTVSIQHCKKHNSLAPPIISSSHRIVKNGITAMSSRQILNCDKDSNKTLNMDIVDTQYLPQQSFIQQRVERLYGPGALAQGFYSPKKIKPKNSNNTILKELDSNPQTEFSRKFKQLSSNRYLNTPNKNSNDSYSNTSTTDETDHCVNNTVDLPVLRHLSQEFRAQLPSISPKRSVAKPIHKTCEEIAYNNNEITHDNSHHANITQKEDVRETEEEVNSSSEASGVTTISSSEIHKEEISNAPEKDGNYFLEMLKKEQSRLLEMAHRAEKYTCSLTNNTEISEEVFGLLRSASGKARLFVSQKMKQFEGLCHNNLNRSPEDAFPTTTEDLQGFWDMMYLQVADIESIFDEIEALKQNHWKLELLEEAQTIIPQKQQTVPNQSKMRSSKKKTTTAKDGSLHHNGNAEVISAAALKREAHRKQLMEMKRKNKIAMNSDNNQSAVGSAIEIFVNENNS